jgi:hypothetical protein
LSANGKKRPVTISRYSVPALDDPFTPVLWVLDVKQPITAEECNKTDGWLPLVALSQVAGVFSMLVMLLSSVLGSVLGVLAWWDYVHQNASDDDVAFYACMERVADSD